MHSARCASMTGLPENKTPLPKLLLISIVSVGCALFAYTVARAYLLSLTPDEASTTQTFGAKFIVYPDTYHNMSANHHWLNSWLIFFSRTLFGENEFAFRLPNLLAHAVYLFFTARLMLLLRRDYFALAGFILLNAHPYVLDFFSLARGYGLAFSGISVALFFLYRFILNGKTKDLIWSLTGGVLSVLANFTVLNVFLPVAGILFIISIWNAKINVGGRKEILKNSVLIFLFTGGLLALILPHLMKLKKAGALFAGAQEFWNGTVRSVCEGLLYDVPYKGSDPLKDCLPSIVVMLGILVFICMAILVKKKWNEPKQLFALSLSAILFSCVLSLWLQHILLDTVFPVQRAGLFVFVMFILAFVGSLPSLPVLPKRITAFAFLLVVPVSFHMLYCANLHYSIEWRGCGDTDYLVKRILEKRKDSGYPNGKVVINSDIEPSCTVYWIQDKWKLDSVEQYGFWPNDTMTTADFYILTKPYRAYRNTKGWKLMDSCPVSENALYIDTTSIYYRK
jgi:hypothetical protein